ncbi:hypothetical protein HUG10_20885 (plasmid) [Halorarum halophilum]|uniref:Homing endonuclease LAGLIDADG domain-containing protein n=1 Tax=Halorarum halophilum TaxID=2743090 RepID=A0A7D5GIP1_9EURY|nr:LAGLIDADG family homing endonuclease [Halobaculum halophilum]QLG30050.1 hypothetical protein HUG10_20885 [Halobaculum halophilum]
MLREQYPKGSIDDLAAELGRTREAVMKKANAIGIARHEDAGIIERIDVENRPSFRDDAFAHFISGFVAGEGSFNVSLNDDARPSFRFCIGLDADDVLILEEIHEFLGVGSVCLSTQGDGRNDLAQYTVQSVADHVLVTVPFFDEYGLQSTLKQRQYDDWRARLFDHYDVEQYVV